MDRALKERVIGAVVLVVAVVLLVPVFLDGPSDDAANVRESITLPGQDEQGARQKTIVLERDRDQPVPAPLPAEPQPAEPQPSKPAPAVVRQAAPEPEKTAEKTAEKLPSPQPSPKSAKSAPAKSATGMWAVQLGSFSNQVNAERLAANLRKEGFAAFLSELNSGGKQLHRVRIGPQKDRASAESVAAKLGTAGHKGQVVPHP